MHLCRPSRWCLKKILWNKRNLLAKMTIQTMIIHPKRTCRYQRKDQYGWQVGMIRSIFTWLLMTQRGEIMNLGVYFGWGYEKSSVVFPRLWTSSKEKLDLYLEFHFVVKTKVVENCVSILSVILKKNYWYSICLFASVWYYVIN